MNWYFEVIKKYIVFSGRASRSEYWYFILFNLLIGMVLGGIESVIGISGDDAGPLVRFYSLFIFLPAWTVAVRRLHDTNRSGWWLLIHLIPVIGTIVFIIFAIEDSTPGDNDYGRNPKILSR